MYYGKWKERQSLETCRHIIISLAFDFFNQAVVPLSEFGVFTVGKGGGMMFSINQNNYTSSIKSILGNLLFFLFSYNTVAMHLTPGQLSW